MIKRVVLMLLIGATLAFGGAGRYERSLSLTITGASSGNDSTVTDSFAVFNTMHYGNRYWMTIDFDSVTQHGAGSTTDSFGLRDSIFVVLFTEFAGQRIVLDSTEDSLKDNTKLTLNFTGSGAGDSIQGYGEHLWLWVKISDTVGLTTDSVATFRFEVSGIHLFQD